MNELTFRLAFPLRRQHLGLPMANGRLGVLVWGEGRELRLTIALADCWDRRFSECLWESGSYDELVAAWTPESVEGVNARLWQKRFPFQRDPSLPYWRGTRLAGGTYALTLAGELRGVELDYPSGVASVETTAGPLELELDLAADQLEIRDGAKLIQTVETEPMWDKLGDSLAPVGFAPPERFEGGWFQPCPEDPGFWTRLSPVPAGWRLTASLRRDVAAPQLPEPDFAASRAWWRNWWEKVPAITLPEEKFNRFYRFALYKFAAATLPGKVPASLQGPWQEDYQLPAWSNDYHFNVNVQQVYTLAFSLGAYEHLLPLFDMLESEAARTAMRTNARSLFGIEDGLLLSHAVDDRVMQVGYCSAGSFLDFVCGGWMGMLYFEYYRHTGNREFLKNRAMPFMRGVMRIFEEALREDDDGRLMIPVATSAEYSCTFPVRRNGKECRQNTGKNPSNELTCCHALANALLAGAAALGEEPKPVWLDIKRRLPRFSTIDGRVAVWEGQDLEVCHRHHSHLSMIYPFDLTAELSDEEREAVDRAVEHWIWRGMGQWSEWCYPWAMMIEGRWGMTEAPSVLLETWSRLFWNESLATVYLPRFRGLSSLRRADMLKPLETNEIMQLDGTMAGATALLEMLVHDRGGVIECFAGIPSFWTEASFDRVRLPGGLLASGVRRGGRTVELRFEASAPCRIRVRPEPGVEVVEYQLEPGTALIKSFAGSVAK